MESSNSGYASNAPRSASVSPAGASSGRAGGGNTNPLAPRRAFRRLHLRQHYLPLLVATTVMTLLVVIGAGYAAARANAVSAAEASARTNAQIAREVVSERGGYPALVNKQLVVSGATNYPLVGDTQVVDHVRQLTGDMAAIYQLDDTSALVSVASNLPKTDGQGRAIANSRATGEPMPADAQAALFGNCGKVNSATACPGDFSGTVTLAGVDYLAAFAPLLAQDGTLVGAVGVLTPLDEVLAPPLQLAIMLLLMGLLVGLVALVVGAWLAEHFPNRLLRELDGQLDTMARAAVELGRLAYQQRFRLQQQQRIARQVGDHALKLEALAGEMDDGQTALHQTTTAIWEAMSQPNVAVNMQMALRLAREAAVRASEVGTAGDATREHARQVITLMNRVIAEGRALAQEGQLAESHARELAETLDRMEADLGERLAARQYEFGSGPVMRHISSVSQRLRQMLQPDDQPSTASSPRATGRPAVGRDGTTGGMGGMGSMGSPGSMGPARTRQPSRPRRDDARHFSPGSFPGAGSLGGLHQGGQPPASPGVSGSRHRGNLSNQGNPGNQSGQGNQGNPGNRGRRPADNQPPGGLPPLGRFDDEPPRGPNDSRWLND